MRSYDSLLDDCLLSLATKKVLSASHIKLYLSIIHVILILLLHGILSLMYLQI